MRLQIQPTSGVPIYRQLFEQLQQQIVSGQLGGGEKLLSVRELSEELHVNMLTVAKVYQHLENEGLVETRRGLGTFVAAGQANRSRSQKQQLILPTIEKLVSEARCLDLTETEILSLVKQALGKRRGGGTNE